MPRNADRLDTPLEKELSRQIWTLQEGGPFQRYLDIAANDFRRAMNDILPGIKVFMMGSFAAKVEIETSDLDFAIEMPPTDDPRSPLEIVQSRLVRHLNLRIFGPPLTFRSFELVGKTRVQVLKCVHRQTGVSIDIVVGCEEGRRNTQLLAWFNQCDCRFAPLCKAVKAWATRAGIKDSKHGYMNSLSFCYLVAQFLQSRNVLPSILFYLGEYYEQIEVSTDEYFSVDIRQKLLDQLWRPYNRDSVGRLYLGFFHFMSSFNFKYIYISVSEGHGRSKSNEHKRKLIFIEDPFSAEVNNCARSLSNTKAKEIIACFRNAQEEIHRTGNFLAAPHFYNRYFA